MKKSAMIRRLTVTAVLCALLLMIAVPVASAASYSKVYGKTQERVRVRESASTNATIIDNIIKGACVYVTSSKESGSNTFIQINYINKDGGQSSGWVCQSDGKTKYVEILSAKQAESTFKVSDGKLPSTRVGTFSASERKAGSSASSTSGSSASVDTETVKEVQRKLKALGYYYGEITGNVGAKTETAIKAFQRKNGLTADGVIGPKTLASLNSAYAGSGASASSSSSTDGSIKLGSTGSAVTQLQQDLTTLGFYSAQITGNAGAKTEAAIKAFQRKYGLTADGVAGPDTLAAIASALRGGISSNGSVTIIKYGSQGSRVSQLQQDLKTLGFYNGQITGNVGSKTEQAIKKFQARYGLTADGYAGPDTLNKIAELVAAKGGSSASASSGSSSSSSSASSGTTLRLDSTGSAVTALQQNLEALGYYYAEITGHYGKQTEAAVRKFQQKHGLTADGVAGPKTLAAIASAITSTGGTVASGSSGGVTLREGDSGSAVTELQNMLTALGYYYGEITGHFGSLTRQAVRKFQADNDLTVDGVAGSATINRLRSMTGSSGSSSSGGSSVGSVVDTKDSYGRIKKDNVYLRSSYSTTSASKASLSKGTFVRITRKVTSGGETWYYISVKLGNYTQTGYVRSDMIDLVDSNDYGGSDKDNDYNDSELIGIVRITGSNVRLRMGPGANYDIVAYAQTGETYYVISQVDGWYQLRNGYWVSSDYARPLSNQEEEDYLDFNSNVSYGYGSTGTMVTFIQEALQYLGYYDREITGHFGEHTQSAVKAFQSAKGLKQTGVVDKETLLKIRDAYYGSGTSGGSLSDGKTVYNVSWNNKTTWYANTAGLKAGASGKLMDISKGLTLEVKVQSIGNHADVEPVTSADTAILCQIYNVVSASSLPYNRRAMILEIKDGYKMLCSIYATPHGKSTISGNNFNGQFCLHFKDSTIHSGDGGTVKESENHQAIIKNAVTTLKNKGYTVVE